MYEEIVGSWFKEVYFIVVCFLVIKLVCENLFIFLRSILFVFEFGIFMI